MRRLTLISLVALTAVCAAAPLLAQYPVPAPLPAPMPQPYPPVPAGYFSPRLQASFVVQSIDLTPYGWPGYRPVAQLVSYPTPYSPLRAIGLVPGDMITRLDDTPISGYGDLENHYALTKITFIRQGTYAAQEQWVDLGPLYPRPVGGGPALPAPGAPAAG